MDIQYLIGYANFFMFLFKEMLYFLIFQTIFFCFGWFMITLSQLKSRQSSLQYFITGTVLFIILIGTSKTLVLYFYTILYSLVDGLYPEHNYMDLALATNKELAILLLLEFFIVPVISWFILVEISLTVAMSDRVLSQAVCLFFLIYLPWGWGFLSVEPFLPAL